MRNHSSGTALSNTVDALSSLVRILEILAVEGKAGVEIKHIADGMRFYVNDLQKIVDKQPIKDDYCLDQHNRISSINNHLFETNPPLKLTDEKDKKWQTIKLYYLRQ